jgi:hypothetical protein
VAANFALQIRQFNERNKQRQLAIFRNSAQRVMEIASVPKAQGGRMPVDTGYLVNSRAASTSGMPGSGGPPAELVFAQLEIGQTVYAGWTAAYALRMEFGFHGADKLGRVYSQEGNAFLRTSVQRWPQIVAEETEQARARIR